MPSFARQSVALVRSSRLARPLPFRRKLPSTIVNTSFAPYRYQSKLTASGSKDNYREDWAKVIEEYKKDKKQVARDLGVALTERARMKAIRSQSTLSTSASKVNYRQNWIMVIEEYKKDKEQVARDLGVAGSDSRMPRILSQFTWTNVLISFFDEAIW